MRRFRLPHRSIAATLLATAALLAGCTQTVSGSSNGSGTPGSSHASAGGTSGTPGSGTSPGPGPAPVAQFHDCSSVLQLSGVSVPASLQGQLSARCGSVQVPLDYAHPGGRSIAITMVVVHDRAAGDHAPSLLMNPGGPGASGVELVLGLLGQLPTSVVRHYDLVGFDPRGVGLSSPLRCVSDRRKDQLLSIAPDVSTTVGFEQARALARSFDDSCLARYGSSLQFYDTVATARDMDRIRAALGERQTDYLGFSYGTELGSVYAHLFPSRVGTMVLDGAVDPLTGSLQQFADQLQGFEDSYDQFGAWCEKTDPCRQLGSPRPAAEQITRATIAHPLPTHSGRRLTYALADTGVLEALYSCSSWPRLAQALLAARHGDGTGLLTLADQYNRRSPNGHYDNLYDANYVISCNDSRPGPSDATIHRLATEWSAKYPLFGAWAAPALFNCQQWQPHRTPPPKPTAPTPTKVLVVGNLHDPATPYQGAKDLTRTMGNAELLSWDGEGHTSYLEGSSCVDGYVTRFLVKDVLPPVSTLCPK